MRKTILLHLVLFIWFNALSQEQGIPSWFLQEIESEIGTWVGNNASYKTEAEPFESYAIQWKWAINKISLVGKMYGVSNGEPSPVFWEFRKYWDAEQQLPVVMQFGADGTVGIGQIKKTSEKETDLVQVFTNPDGSQYRARHRTSILDASSHIGTSFLINPEGEWTENRSYTWIKENEPEIGTTTNLTIQDLSFLQGKWKAIAPDSTYSLLEYKFSPGKKLLLTTNQLYNKKDILTGLFEGTYMVDRNELIFFMAGPSGETYNGTGYIQNDTLTHLGHIYPGKYTKSYKSQLILKDDKLYYYASFSREVDPPTEIDDSKELIYDRWKE